MALPVRMQLACLRHILRQRFSGTRRYPLVLMLEPLFSCNLSCAGCGKVQYPAEVMRRRLSPQECFDAAEECGAPIVTVAGGEPLIHPQVEEIVSGLIARGRYVYLCTNALLLEKNLSKFRPSSQFVLSIHLDGPKPTHDRTVGREGVFDAAVSAIRAAKSRGFCVMTNSTVFVGEDPRSFRDFFDLCVDLGVDGMTISPGYAYESAPEQGRFLESRQTQEWFRKVLDGRKEKGWPFNHSPFYLDFLEGKRDYDCSPWGTPLRSVLGWQRPCYLLSDGEPAKTYRELLDKTRWELYGRASGNTRCADCMAHVGYEPSAVVEAFSSPARFLELVSDVLTTSRPRRSAR